MCAEIRRSSPLTKIWQKSGIEFLGSPFLPVFLGSAAYIWLYFLNNSLWRDESKLLLNTIHKSFFGLMGSLDHGQEAPLMLLWLYKVLYLTGFPSELAYRFFSLLAIIISLWLFAKLARILFREPPAILFATWLFALSPGIILYAAQAKQYTLDILVSIVLLWLAVKVFFSPNPTRFSFIWLAVAATLAPWFSIPAVFTCGILVIILIFTDKIIIGRRFILCFPIIISSVMSGLLVLSRSLAPTHAKLAKVFPVATADAVHNPQFYVSYFFAKIFFGYIGFGAMPYAYFTIFHNNFSLALLGLSLVCLIGIFVAINQYGFILTFLLGGPLVMAVMLFLIKLYPNLGRAFLFATPGIYLLGGFGFGFLYKRLRYPGILYLLLILLLLPCITTYYRCYFKSIGGVREALEFISRHGNKGNIVFCDPCSASSVAWYLELKNAAATKLVYLNRPQEWIEGKIDPDEENLEQLFKPYAHQPIWLLAEDYNYHRVPGYQPNQFFIRVRQYLDKSRQEEVSYITSGVFAIRFSPASKNNLRVRLADPLGKRIGIFNRDNFWVAF